MYEDIHRNTTILNKTVLLCHLKLTTYGLYVEGWLEISKLFPLSQECISG